MWESSFVCLLLFDSWETDCVWFGKIASLFARVCKLLLGIPPESGSARLGHIPSLPGKPQLPLKPCISLQPFYFKRQLRFLRFSLRFQCVLINTSVKGDSLSPLTIPLRRAEPARPQFRLRRFLLALLIVNTTANKFSYQCGFWNPIQRQWHLLFQNRF